MKVSTKLICLSGVAALIGCQSNTGFATGSNNANNSAANNLAFNKQMVAAGTVSVDALGVLPVSANSNSNYLMRINNHSKEKYTLQKIEVSNNLLTVNTTACTDLAPGASCSIELDPHTAVSGDAVVKLYFKDSKGKIQQLDELVRMSSKLHSKSGVSMQNGFTQVVAADGNYSLALPVQLEQDYESITALNGSLVCKVNNFKAGNSCTYLINGHALEDNTLVNTGLRLTTKGGSTVTQAGGSVLIKTINTSNLVATAEVSITVDNTMVKHITITNHGNSDVTFGPINYGAPLVAATTPTGATEAVCATTLAANSSCGIYFKADPEKVDEDSGSNAIISVDYKDGIKDKQLKSTVSLEYLDNKPVLDILDQQQLVNKVAGAQYKVVFVLSNSGGATYNFTRITPSGFTGATISRDLSLANDINECKGSLSAGAGCNISMIYSPNTAMNGGRGLITVTGSYQSGDQQNLNPRFVFDYSTIAASDARIISLIGLDPMRILTTINNSETRAGYTADGSFELTNTAPLDRTIAPKGFTFKGQNTGLNAVTGDCSSADLILDSAKTSCIGKFKFGTRDTATVPGTPDVAFLEIAYRPEGSERDVKAKSSNFTLEAYANAAVINTKVEIIENPEFSNGGDGYLGNKIDFLALKDAAKKLKVRYTFTNDGNDKATKFFPIVSMFPVYTKISPASTCRFIDGLPVIMDIESGNSCFLDIELPRDDRFARLPNLVDDFIQPGYGFIDVDTGVNRYEELSQLKRSFTFSRQWVNITSQPAHVEINSDLSGWLATIEVSAALDKRLEAQADQIFPIAITPVGNGPVGHDSLMNGAVEGCDIISNNASCTTKISLDGDSNFTSDNPEYALQASGKAGTPVANNTSKTQYEKLVLIPYKLAYFAAGNNQGYSGDLVTEAEHIYGQDGSFYEIPGIYAADFICENDANKPANSKRGFYAALTSDIRGFCDSEECVYQPSTTYYNTDRQKMFTTDKNGLPMGDSAIEADLIPTAGNTLTNIWLGYSDTQIEAGNSTFTDNCNNWTSSATSNNSYIAGLTAPWLSGTTTGACNQKHAIMCIER